MPGKPLPIGDILAELMARRGYGREETGGRCAEAWGLAVGAALGARSRAGRVRRGVLEVCVGSSVVAQELSFQKEELLAKLARLAPEENIADLRFRVGPIS